MTHLACDRAAVIGNAVLGDRTMRRQGGSIIPLRVREVGPGYEDEGSECCSIGSVSVPDGGWWSARLTVPVVHDAGAPATTLFLGVERHGDAPESYRGDVRIDMSLPASEVDAVVTLLEGVLAQARRNGVLPHRSA